MESKVKNGIFCGTPTESDRRDLEASIKKLQYDASIYISNNLPL